VAFHLDYRTTRWGSWTSFDIAGNGMAVKRLTISYAHATRLDWYVTANESTAPIPRLAWVRLWDDAGVDESGTAQSSSNPLFFGRVVDVEPGQHSNQVNYVAFDPTYWAAKTTAVLSLPYDIGDISTNTEPQGYVGAVPRLVYNVKNTADDDYSYEAGQNGTVGTIIAGLLDYTYQPLYWLDAAPGDGTNAGHGSPYVSGDLTNMDFIPQQKIVWESMTIRSALEQMWRCEPRYRMLWNPASKKWRFIQYTQSPTVTLNLNDSGLSNAHPVVGLDIKPSYEDCQTAVSIYGPPTNETTTFYWDDTLTSWGSTNIKPVGSPTVLQTYSDGSGPHDVKTWQKWQIVDTYSRPGSRTLPTWVQLPVDSYEAVSTRFPSFLVSWDYGTTWTACWNVWFDFLQGTINFIGTFPYVEITSQRGELIVPGSTQTVFAPNACKLYWAPYKTPLSVRYPSTGYAGTAYDLVGLQSEYRLYDESLAIGKEYGTPVTSVERKAQYTKLAQSLHETRKDVIYTGHAVLHGIDYSWCRLNKRVNVADAAGTTTGWEAINAAVTDVEYTYGDQPSTTLSFNANWSELYGEDCAQARERLRIQSFTQYTYSQMYGLPIVTQTATSTTTNMFGDTTAASTKVTISDPFVYVDQYGNKQSGSIR
jgi:hypothetical protein